MSLNLKAMFMYILVHVLQANSFSNWSGHINLHYLSCLLRHELFQIVVTHLYLAKQKRNVFYFTRVMFIAYVSYVRCLHFFV